MMKSKNHRKHLRVQVAPIKVAQILIVVHHAKEVILITSLRGPDSAEATLVEIKEMEMMTMIKINNSIKEIRRKRAEVPLKRGKIKERLGNRLKRLKNNKWGSREKIRHSQIIN